MDLFNNEAAQQQRLDVEVAAVYWENIWSKRLQQIFAKKKKNCNLCIPWENTYVGGLSIYECFFFGRENNTLNHFQETF